MHSRCPCLFQAGLGSIPDLAKQLASKDSAYEAAKAIADMTHNGAREATRAREEVAVADGGFTVRALVKLLGRRNTEGVQLQAAAALHNLAINGKISKAIAAAGAFHPLVALLGPQTSPAVQKQVDAALQMLTVNEANAARDDAATAIAPLVVLLSPGSVPSSQQHAAAVLQHLAAGGGHVMEVIEAGAVPRLVLLLGHQSTAALQEEAALALLALLTKHNMGIKTVYTDIREGIIAADAIAPLVALLRNHENDAAVQTRATQLLGNLVTDKNGAFEVRMNADGVPGLVALLRGGVAPEVQTAAVEAVKNLLAMNVTVGDEFGVWDDSITDAFHTAGIVPLLAALLGPHSCTAVLEQAAGALRAISEDSSGAYSLGFCSDCGADFISALVTLLGSQHTAVAQEEAALALGNIAANRHYDAQIETFEGWEAFLNFNDTSAFPTLLLRMLGDQSTAAAREEATALLMQDVPEDKDMSAEYYDGLLIAGAGAIPLLVALLTAEPRRPPAVQDHAARTLGILAHTQYNQVLIAAAGAIAPWWGCWELITRRWCEAGLCGHCCASWRAVPPIRPRPQALVPSPPFSVWLLRKASVQKPLRMQPRQSQS